MRKKNHEFMKKRKGFKAYHRRSLMSATKRKVKYCNRHKLDVIVDKCGVGSFSGPGFCILGGFVISWRLTIFKKSSTAKYSILVCSQLLFIKDFKVFSKEN
jgi:hypothetical protein